MRFLYPSPKAVAHPMDPVTNAILINNLHCSSCVNTIHSHLDNLDPKPLAIHVSIVSQSVTVEHTPDLTLDRIQDALVQAGFDISQSDIPSNNNVSSLPDVLRRRRQKHLENCAMCRDQQSTKTASSMPSAPTLAGSHRTQSKQSAVDHPGPFNATYSVGGMTCASCSNTIKHQLSQMTGLSDVVVNLMGHSMTLTATNRELVDQVVEHVDDIGYEAQLVEVRPAGIVDEEDQEVGERIINIKIEGMYCDKCPTRVMEALHPMESKGLLTIHKAIESKQDPVVKLSYKPAAPAFTIRHILQVIEGVESVNGQARFRPSVYHPPTLEALSRQLQENERKKLFYRTVFSILLAIPTFIIGIAWMTLLPKTNPLREWVEEPMWAGSTSRAVWALFFLATPAQFYSAYPFHRRSIKEIRALWRKGSKTPIWMRFIRFGSMDLLISLGVSISYFSSIALLAISSTRMPEGNMGDDTTYFDSVVFLTMFLLIGRYLEMYSKSRTADAVSSLALLRPSKAMLVADPNDPALANKHHLTRVNSEDLEKGSIEDPKVKQTIPISTSLLEFHDIVRVVHGASPPADGIIVSQGSSLFDESSLTGESKLVTKGYGDRIYVGTLCKGQPVDVKVDKLDGQSMLDHIVEVVRSGQSKRAPIERYVDILTGYFVPVVTLFSILTWLIWLGLGEAGALPADYLDISIGGWPLWSLRFAIATFVIACPCGIGLAAPTALLVGSGLAAKFGILVRGGGEAFQEAAQLDIVVFDKTGTITLGGDPKVTEHVFDEGSDSATVAGTILALESLSSHPLALALVEFCKGQGAPLLNADDVEEIPGRGLKAHFPTLKLDAIIGNEKFMEENSAKMDQTYVDRLNEWKSKAQSVVVVAHKVTDAAGEAAAEFRVVGILAVADPLRPEARDVVHHLQQQGLVTWMISGDNETTAKAVASMVGIPEGNVIAGVLPHEKADRIQWLQRVGMKRKGARKGLNSRAIVAMCGDGINDAPALTAADVGIAVGSGSDVAISSASFILMSSNLWSIVTLTHLSRTVFRRIKFNFAWALVYNCIGIPIAAGVIYPAGHARLDPVWASLAMALSSVSVVCSSLLLKLYHEPKARN